MSRFIILGLIVFFLFACEDVIEVNLEEENPRLVIDAVIEVDRSLECVPVKIKTSLSTNFFNEIESVSVESIKLIIESLNEFGDTAGSATIQINESESESGIYEICLNQSTFNTELVYYLSVMYNERFYFSRTRFQTATTLDDVKQGDNTFADEDDKEIIVSFTDDGEKQNFYIFNFEKGNFTTTEDSFFQGEEFSFSYFAGEEYEIGELLEIKLLGADREFFNYMNLVIEQSDNAGNIFDTPSATIRGNIFDFTDIDNRDQFDNTEATETFPLGYFAVVEASKKSLILN